MEYSYHDAILSAYIFVGVYTHTFNYEKREDCPVCGVQTSIMTVSSKITLKEFIQLLTQDSN